MSMYDAAIEYAKKVSVPYRGATFLNLKSVKAILANLEFPSPIGELHFSMSNPGFAVKWGDNVSVPYRGATFLNNTEFCIVQ